MKTYNDRQWLNGDDFPYTESVVAFDGFLKDEDNKDYRSTFLQVSDCFSKVKLHKATYDSMYDFIAKMKKLRFVLDDFIEHLENNREIRQENME